VISFFLAVYVHLNTVVGSEGSPLMNSLVVESLFLREALDS
jgi:hypothetical protein